MDPWTILGWLLLILFGLPVAFLILVFLISLLRVAIALFIYGTRRAK